MLRPRLRLALTEMAAGGAGGLGFRTRGEEKGWESESAEGAGLERASGRGRVLESSVEKVGPPLDAPLAREGAMGVKSGSWIGPLPVLMAEEPLLRRTKWW
jgi:hypothetical protein